MRYLVTVITHANEIRYLELDAEDERAAESAAKGRGLTVIAVVRRDVGARDPRGIRSTGNFSLLLFSQHLVSLLEAGLTAVEALEALADDEEKGAIAERAGGLLAAVRRGLSLSSAMALDGGAFPEHYIAIVKGSEHSGAVAEALRRWSEHQARLDAAQRQARQALVYPAILMVAGGAVCLFLLGYVVPRFASIYDGRLDDLPWMSRGLIALGQFIATERQWLLPAALTMLLGSIWLAHRVGLRYRLAHWAWRLPLIGRAMRIHQLARLYRSLGMLLRSGMPLTDAMALSPGLVSAALRPNVIAALAQLQSGASLRDSFDMAGLTTTVGVRMLQVAERTGEAAAMMDRMADYHDDETSRALGAFTRIFEPAVMALIGLLVGGIVILMYIPIFELAGRLQS